MNAFLLLLLLCFIFIWPVKLPFAFVSFVCMYVCIGVCMHACMLHTIYTRFVECLLVQNNKISKKKTYNKQTYISRGFKKNNNVVRVVKLSKHPAMECRILYVYMNEVYMRIRKYMHECMRACMNACNTNIILQTTFLCCSVCTAFMYLNHPRKKNYI